MEYDVEFDGGAKEDLIRICKKNRWKHFFRISVSENGCGRLCLKKDIHRKGDEILQVEGFSFQIYWRLRNLAGPITLMGDGTGKIKVECRFPCDITSNLAILREEQLTIRLDR
jgi:hypothetical protein